VNKDLREISNDNGVTVVNVAISKNLTIESTFLQHRNNQKFTWTSDRGTAKPIDHILIYVKRHSSVTDVRSFMAADCVTRGKSKQRLHTLQIHSCNLRILMSFPTNSMNRNIKDLYKKRRV
jgi:hypothetical protein